LEECLAAVAAHVADGTDKVNVAAAKSVLRSRGQGKLASRLGRLSKLRNSSAHPDRGLLHAIKSALIEPTALRRRVLAAR